MSSRIRLNALVEQLNVMLNRPAAYFNKDGSIALGHLALDYNNSYPYPYSLNETVSTSGGEKVWSDRMTYPECLAYLGGIADGLQFMMKMDEQSSIKLEIKDEY